MAIIMAGQVRLPIGSIAFVSAFLVAILSAVGSAGAASAADCLTAPGSSAPPNSHWYYRTDRTTQHKCWFLRALDGSSSQGAVTTTQSAAAAVTYSLADFKDFMAQRGNADLSDKDVEQLYAQFLEWRRRPENSGQDRQ
jgi:hypothetical protein